MDMREIARRAKVSVATVSRAINRVPTVDPQLAKRVWKVVDEVGYYPNTHARSLALVSGESRIVGLVFSEITNPFVSEIVQTFEDLAMQNNYETILTSTMHDRTRMKSLVRRMIESRVDGVAILTFGMEESLLDDLRLCKMPLVFVDIVPDAPRVNKIRIDYENGIRQAVQHLAALRHTAIAFVAGPEHLRPAEAMKEAFRSAMRKSGLAVPREMVSIGDRKVESGKALSEVMELHEQPTALLCSNDLTAIAVLREAFDLGLKVPRDLSVVGFGDIPLSAFITPPLTTIQMSQTHLAKIAFQALMNDVAENTLINARKEYLLTTNLVVRRSTALAVSH